MAGTNRRDLFKAMAAGALVAPLAPLAGATSRTAGNAMTATACTPAAAAPVSAHGVEGQRIADLGDGRFLNPIVAGDRPDPSILKDGDDYYMTFSSFDAYPGLPIWHSTDLVNWAPISTALHTPLGTIWAVDICKHEGRYFIYLPANPPGKGWETYVIWADDIRGPWSEPINLGIDGCIDPGHVVGEDGTRYLFVNGIRRIRLRADGLAVDGTLEAAYSPWRYPEHWITENFAPEGPKLLRHNGWFYLVTAVGGTAGPVTGHMVIAARARSIDGPWEHCPHNPLVRTLSEDEPWWSRGHATLVEGPAGDWWMVYHGYENGFRTLGRQTLLEPIEWTDDGWFRALGGDLGQPLRKPRGGKAGASGAALSDDFSTDRFGIQWAFHAPGPREMDRVQRTHPGLMVAATGTSPADSSPLTCVVPDRRYQVEVTLEPSEGAEGGLLLFYNSKAYVGLGFTHEEVRTHQYSEELVWARYPRQGGAVRVRLTNIDNVITFHHSRDDGKTWTLHQTRMEVSGMHHNVFGGFVSLRVGLSSTGTGKVAIRDFVYRGAGHPAVVEAGRAALQGG